MHLGGWREIRRSKRRESLKRWKKRVCAKCSGKAHQMSHSDCVGDTGSEQLDWGAGPASPGRSEAAGVEQNTRVERQSSTSCVKS